MDKQPVRDDPIDASSNAEYIEHCADRLERCGLPVTASALRAIAHVHRALAEQAAANAERAFFAQDFYEEAREGKKPWPAQQPAADLRSTHRVWRGDDWQPCYCEATDDHRIGSEQAEAAHEPCAAVAAIQFALTDPEGMTFLRLWNEGEFDTLRREWPDALRKIYNGADPLAQQRGKVT